MRVHPTIYEDDVGIVSIEYVDSIGVLIHCDIKIWTPSAYKHCKRVWKAILHNLEGINIYTVCEPKDIKLLKFVKAFGFVPVDGFVYTKDGVFRRLLCHKQQQYM